MSQKASGALSRETYDPIREIVVQIREKIESTVLESWVGWADAFAAGITSEIHAWRAAEEAGHEAVKIRGDTSARNVMLAAEDAAWAAAHATAGNLSLALECTLRARELLQAAPSTSERSCDNRA